jgi:hypothetical protein
VTAKVSRKRLRELLVARARIVNANELHNRWMVRTGRVKRRAGAEEEEESVVEEQREEGGAQEADGELGVVEEGVQHAADNGDIIEQEGAVQHIAEEPEMVQQEEVHPAADDHQMVVDDNAVQPVPHEDMPAPSAVTIDSSGPRPSVVAASLANLAIVAALRSGILPISFIVRVVNSTAGTAILASQLLPASQQSDPVTVNDLSFDKFLTLASQELGFDVRGRISAVLPKFHIIAPYDSIVELNSEVKWKAVLQAWQTTRRKMCEFVVDREAMEE